MGSHSDPLSSPYPFGVCGSLSSCLCLSRAPCLGCPGASPTACLICPSDCACQPPLPLSAPTCPPQAPCPALWTRSSGPSPLFWRPLTCSPEDFPGPGAAALTTLRVGRLLAKALLSAGSRGGRPAVAMGAGAVGWLGTVGVPDGACPLTSTDAVGLLRGPRLAEVCGAAGAPPALFWRMIPDGT